MLAVQKIFAIDSFLCYYGKIPLNSTRYGVAGFRQVDANSFEMNFVFDLP